MGVWRRRMRPVLTRLLTEHGWLDFQEYFVHRRCEPVVSKLQFQGAGAARPHPDFIAALADQALEAVSTQATMELIKSLPREQAEIILLRVVAGLDAGDVAKIVGKTPGAVRVAAHRGLRRLAAQVAQAGVTL